MWGVGVPLAIHLRVTGGPGWRVWAMNLYWRLGAEAGDGGNGEVRSL